ncbi:AraC family transcriptional regulator [Clostridioides difficile]|uniref:AraC family transcriptional regulator n=1 Tax=Clostridioides difficile TaxID=1496 RepID=UPI000D1DC601|nr:AraC family transcriptional regulator [Clostridioides difficile]UUC40545.1 AraC family transcriptional regulator [Clostridioides difficile]UWD42622.1 AraC family transcriptional regulator [Clostridioides difficile]UWD46259.1 AraC family transcriptional regulator [Clostridioides difficile]VFF91771.1 AraC family transcriptional regulator [Clostridioides difficile]VIF61277.1 AraC family transcriptional regulator [Clostridioides difficile]
MEWIERLNKAINYIEENITKEIEYEQVAKIACCSTYHFQRMFAYMADVPLSEYIRRRRMSLAAVELQNDDKKIIDVALKYGYSSPTAFNRAFKSIHGAAPSVIKKGEITTLKAFPPISFKISIKGAEEMNYRIEKKEAFRIVGVSQPLHNELEKNFEIVPQMWQKVSLDGTLQKLIPLMDSLPQGVLGISICNNSEEWKYFISVSSTKSIDDTLEEYTVPAFNWAIFSGEGQCPQAIQELEKRIVTEWLPTSGYEYDNGPDIELYLNPDPQNAKFEVWIPVVKK